MAIARKSGFTLVLVVAVMVMAEGLRYSLSEGTPVAEALPLAAKEAPGADAEPAPSAEPAPLEEMPMEERYMEAGASPALSGADAAYLEAAGWQDRVGEGLGIWVCVERQRCYLLEGMTVQMDMVCATAEAGTGFIENSMQTPLGWHEVAKKIGDGEPWGRVFRARAVSDEIWQPGTHTGEDLVLTRILWLAGLEPGKNQGNDAQGRCVDSEARFIYLHGTNEEARLGTPSSHGCIRLRNDDVIALYQQAPVGTPVLITERQ